MNAKPALRMVRAFSLMDLLILVGTAVLVVVLLLPMIAKRTARASRINCVNNLKQVGLGFRMWADDNADNFPMHASTNVGGSKEWVATGAVAPHFAVISNELATPRILVCPQDSRRKAATNFATLRDAQISYFVVAEANEGLHQLWLAGDRNLATNGKALAAGAFTVTTNTALGWTAEQHINQGNVAFGDGSVRQFSSSALAQSATNALAVCSAATSNMTFRILLP